MIPMSSAAMTAATMQHSGTVLAQQAEEEKNVPEGGGDGREYEYKILRTAPYSRQFSDRVAFQRVLAEEAATGWELHEKLDNFRMRLRRLTSCRVKDALLTQDPYRTFVDDPPARRRMNLTFTLAMLVILILYFLVAFAR
ncbi:MAG: hypothetical protein JWN14_1943 [Chthonomonadales bacterium]|nr:hypothetical protein [Chthonomonadales bacterium]